MSIVEVLYPQNNTVTIGFSKSSRNEIVVIQLDHTAVNKTDKRYAEILGALLWNNRKRSKADSVPMAFAAFFLPLPPMLKFGNAPW
jgi:hypothetical protein